MNKLYTAQEVADRLKIKKTTVYELIKRGELESSKIGKQLRVSEEQLTQYLNRNSSGNSGSGQDIPYTSVNFEPESSLLKRDYLLHSSGIILGGQTWKGCVIAASVIAFPLMYRNARAAFEQVDVNLIAAGKTLGMSDRRIFWTVVMPTAGPGIASGTVLAFARAIGEYGATSMLAGNILGKTRTVSVAIASETAAGNYGMAGFWVVVILIISFVIVAAINIVSGKGMKMGRWM